MAPSKSKFFVWENSDTGTFTKAPLRSRFCTARTSCGRQCKNRVVIGLPHCHKHREGYVIKHTGSYGLGLFAKCQNPNHQHFTCKCIVFEAGESIAPYIGQNLLEVETDDRYGQNATAPYSVIDNRSLRVPMVVDSALVRCAAACSNDAYRRYGLTNNANLVACTSERWPWLEASKDITNGEEILTNYGRGYWEGQKLGFFTI
jgi:hypothetical protein